jgi:hypothetical protein
VLGSAALGGNWCGDRAAFSPQAPLHTDALLCWSGAAPEHGRVYTRISWKDMLGASLSPLMPTQKGWVCLHDGVWC